MSEKKFTEEELNKISNIQEKYIEIQQKFGQVKLGKLRLDNQQKTLEKLEESLLDEFEQIQIDEKDFVDNITKKYGDGTLNPENGIFTPNK